jgi:hypothetical protein
VLTTNDRFFGCDQLDDDTMVGGMGEMMSVLKKTSVMLREEPM